MNDFEERGFLGRNIVWIVVLLAVVIFGFLLFKGWDKIVNEEIDERITITGNFSCLPLKDGSIPAPETTPDEDCALGVRSRDGLFYALDISRIQDANQDLRAEDTIAVTGTMRPVSEIPQSEWAGYEVAGIIKVNTLLRTR